jgi:hypothetical protein
VTAHLTTPVVDGTEAGEEVSSAIRASVKIRGWVPVLMAAFSAGKPKESNPMGLSTPLPRMVW